MTADVGSTVQFNCSYSGHPLSIDWYHNAKPLYYLDNRMRLINKNVLVISKVQRQDRGVYQCIVRNDRDSQQASTILDLGGESIKSDLLMIHQTTAMHLVRKWEKATLTFCLHFFV